MSIKVNKKVAFFDFELFIFLWPIKLRFVQTSIYGTRWYKMKIVLALVVLMVAVDFGEMFLFDLFGGGGGGGGGGCCCGRKKRSVGHSDLRNTTEATEQPTDSDTRRTCNNEALRQIIVKVQVFLRSSENAENIGFFLTCHEYFLNGHYFILEYLLVLFLLPYGLFNFKSNGQAR